MDLPPIERVEAVRLEPGDVVVLTVAQPIPMAVAESLKEQLRPVFPGHKVLIVSQAELEILRPGEQQVHEVLPPLAPGDAPDRAG